MIRRPVKSSNIAAIGFESSDEQVNEQVGTMEVEFKSGHVYRYEYVPRELYEEFLGASSVGRFFNQRLAGQYGEELIY